MLPWLEARFYYLFIEAYTRLPGNIVTLTRKILIALAIIKEIRYAFGVLLYYFRIYILLNELN